MKKPKTLQELFTDKSRWCKKVYAKNTWGNPTKSTSEDAASWCMLGAVTKVYGSKNKSLRVTDKIRERVGCIITWNDRVRRRFSDVVALVKELDI